MERVTQEDFYSENLPIVVVMYGTFDWCLDVSGLWTCVTVACSVAFVAFERVCLFVSAPSNEGVKAPCYFAKLSNLLLLLVLRRK